MKLGSQDIGLEMPDETQKKSDYYQILANLIDYLKQKDHNAKTMPPLFTMPDKIAPVHDFILQMCSRAGNTVFYYWMFYIEFLFILNGLDFHHDLISELQIQSMKLNPLTSALLAFTKLVLGVV